MKKIYPILAGCAALAIGATVFASTIGNHSLDAGKRMEAPTTIASSRSANHAPSKIAKAPADATPYWCEAISNFTTEGQFSYYDGATRNFGTHISIDGDNATIYGLIDLYYDEADNEYPVTGKYDSRRNTITISGTQYASEGSLSDYVKIADMYGEQNGGEYVLVLFAGDFDYSGNVNTIPELVFNVSDDLSTITPTTGYGAYAFNTSGGGMGFYDYYRTSTMTKAADGISVTTSVAELTFQGLFLCTGTPQSETFNIFNKGSEPINFSASAESDDLALSVTSGTIEACSSFPVTATFTPSHAGVYNDEIAINVEGLDAPVIVKLNAEVQDRPDYMKIVAEGSEAMTFDMSPVYPFVESEYDGHLAFMSTNEGKGDNTESWFVCNIEIPKGKTGIFSWSAVQMEKQPNCLIVLLDGEYYKYDMYVQSLDPYDVSGTMVLTEGKHEVAFDNYVQMDWSEFGQTTRSFVWGLNLSYMDTKANNVYCADTDFSFASTFFDKLSVESIEEITIFNTGINPLKVTEIVGNGNFSGIVPEVSVPMGGEIQVPLKWTAVATGTDSGTVTIKTTGGDITVNCSGTANALPADYSAIVSSGEISFNTSVDYPFVMAANNKYAYNSSSKADIGGITFSWLDASFEVEEGKVAILNWDALNDSEKIFYFMDIPSVVSGTMISIDGGEEQCFGGEGVDCSSADYTDTSALTFKQGRHNVRFTYKKTSNEDSYIFGDDRLKLFEISVETYNIEDFKGKLSGNSANFSNPVYCGCVGHLPFTLYNYTEETPEITGVECDGPFDAKVKEVKDGNLMFNVEFNAKKAGEYENVLTLHTNIGDFLINCKGTAEESSIGYALFYESFEYDFLDNWVIDDNNNDNNSWMPVAPNLDDYSRYNASAADGSDALMIAGYNPNTYDYFEMDDYATTPEIEIPIEGHTTLRFMDMNYTYNEQTLEVLVGEGNDISTYTLVESVVNGYISAWQPVTVDLTAFAGKKVRIAFRAVSDYGLLMAIDDVLVANDSIDGIMSFSADKAVVAHEYFTTDGKLLSEPVRGINIEVVRFSDGTSLTRKITVK